MTYTNMFITVIAGQWDFRQFTNFFVIVLFSFLFFFLTMSCSMYKKIRLLLLLLLLQLQMGRGKWEVVRPDPRGWSSLETTGSRQSCQRGAGITNGGAAWELETLKQRTEYPGLASLPTLQFPAPLSLWLTLTMLSKSLRKTRNQSEGNEQHYHFSKLFSNLSFHIWEHREG